MIGFWLKKNLCDGWDNTIVLFLYNVFIDIAVAVAVLCYFGSCRVLDSAAAASLLPAIKNIIAMAVIIVCMMFCAIPLFAANEHMNRIADFKAVKVLDFFSSVPGVWKMAVKFGAFFGAVIVLLMNALPFYLNLWKNGSLFALLLAAVVFWAGAICLLSLQWFMPLYARMKGGFRKTLKKCFILFFDNTNFTLFMFAYSLVLAVISALLVTFIPGSSGLLLAHDNALRLRLYKYDWLEEHPGLTPKQMKREIPWAALIAEDKEILGPRDFRSFLFPWK